MRVQKAPSKPAKKPASADEYVRGLSPARKKEAQAVRKFILGANPRITEEIKWAAPSFAYGEHFVTFNAWAKDYVELIFHHGPKKATAKGLPIDDPDGLLIWLATDRASMRFYGMKDVLAKKAALQSIVRKWITAMGSEPAIRDIPSRKSKAK